MADLAYQNNNVVLRRSGTDWGAIWAGVFTFIAIWSVFGLLGMAIFSSAVNGGGHAATSMGVGMAIWAIVLTIIAMYVAGRETGRLAAVTSRHDGLIHGMIMFGLSVVGTLLISAVGSMSMGVGTGAEASAHTPYLLSVLSSMGWIGFLSLFLGWLAAMWGASSGAGSTQTPIAEVTKPADATVRQMKPAA
jgi:drug/metabolite transporter (DMT)-like permease